MRTGAVVAIVAGVLIALYWAFSRGIIGSGGLGVRASGGVIAPQPSSNYSGYLAATTAPQVSGILNTVLSGVNSGLHSWLAPAQAATPAPTPAPAASPALAAQPQGPSGLNDSALFYSATPVGPQVDPTVSYAATSGAAYDLGGLASQNAFDPSSSLEFSQGLGFA